MLKEIINTFNWSILWYLIALTFGYIILLTVSLPDILEKFRESEIDTISDIVRSYALQPVTIIIPAYNEQENILDAVYSAINNNYANKHILVINDGSTDNTLQLLIDTFNLQTIYPILPKYVNTRSDIRGYYISKYHLNLTVIDKINTGKGDSLNVGVNVCKTPLFATVDADTILEPDAIGKIVYYALSKPNTVAAGGAVYILNGCKFHDGKITDARMSLKPLYAFQTCEYLRSFLFNRSGWNAFGGALSFAGAFTLFNHKAVIEIGGFDADNLAQDFEVITHLHEYQMDRKRKYTIGYTPSASVWTDVPGTLKSYWQQRSNWQRDTLRSLMLHQNMFFNPKYGMVGLYNYPFYLLGETLGCIVEFTAYILILFSWYVGLLDVYWAILFFIICIGFVTFLTVANAFISIVTFNKYHRLSDLLYLFFISLFENIGFRQYHLVCRVVASIKYFINWLKH